MAGVPESCPEVSRSGITLRRWQREAAQAACRWWQAEVPEPALICAVMGAGKTHLTGSICAAWAAECHGRECVVVMVPSVNLIYQTRDKLASDWLAPGRVGTWFGKEKSLGTVIVTTYDSARALAQELHRDRRAVRFILADEAHQTENARGHASLGAFGEGVPTLGLTATPYRSDKKAKIQKFEQQIYRYGPEDGLRDGVLVYYDTHSAERDFESDHVDDICAEMAQEARKLGPMVCNAVSVEDAEAFAKRLTSEGIPAKAISYKTQGSIHVRGTESWRLVRKLQEGALGCLVYPSLLSEGVDLPWLVSLIMRRKISSRVRFAQEVGRVLRACDGKGRAHLWDPHDLTNELSITYEAALGWIEPDPNEVLQEAIEKKDRKELAGIAEQFPDLPPATKLTLATAYTRRISNAWRQAGRLTMMRSKGWRSSAATPNQLRALARTRVFLKGRVATRELPLIEGAINEALAGRMDRGTVADLLDICMGMVAAKDVWPPGWETQCNG
jgi:superfamily II DNA or RNA helicase